MKILHVWSCAGISSLIGKYMDELHDTKSDVMITKKWNKLGLNRYRTIEVTNKPMFALNALFKASGYDIIHVHYHSIFVPFLKLMYGKKPVVMHFHGSDCRGRWDKVSDWAELADTILVSTPDLLDGAPEGTIYLPNPVDTEMFYNENKPRQPTAVHFSYHANDLASEYTSTHGLELEIVLPDQKIPHLQMPQLLNKYEYYIDIKRNAIKHVKLLEAMSKTGLEALACGCKVVRWDGEIVEGLPDQHRPENVVKRLYEIYQEVV